MEKLIKTAKTLAKFEPDFASITFGAGGSVKARTFETCLAVRDAIAADVVPHLSCLGQSRAQIEAQLERYVEAGFTRLLALRGDVPLEFNSISEMTLPEDGFRYANELVSFIKSRGDFHIFVGCYPEGHPEAPSLQNDLENFVRKVEAGADIGVTQYFFNNAAYFRFVEELRQRGLDIPIIVGLMPAAPYEQVLRFSEKCGADLPVWIRKRMEGYIDDPESQYEFAVEVAVQQAEELLQSGAPGIHFYTLNRPEATLRICEHLCAQQVSFGASFEDVAFNEIESTS
jgi:methylenetetrahydrofolate reductase (NADPH)